MSLQKSATRGVPVSLQTSATSGNGIVLAIPPSFRNHTFTIKGGAGISAGKIKCETADAPDFSGTWALLGTEQTLVSATELLVVVSNQVLQFVRARFSTTATGSTASSDVNYVGY